MFTNFCRAAQPKWPVRRPFRAGILMGGLLALSPLTTHAQMAITEFLANNRAGLLDGDGDSSDWIELQNTSDQPVNLGGWSLTDDPTQPRLWLLPSTNVPAGGYLLVFASGKNRSSPGAPLHTSFSLATDGGYLALFGPENTTPSTEFAPYPRQEADISYGLRAGQRFYFNPPTPLAANAGGFSDFVADTKFSQDRGFYETPFDLTITTATANAAIRYTTNGATPTATTGFLYSAPLRITHTMVVRAAAFRAGLQPSNVDTQTYLFLADVIRQQTNGAAPSSEWPNPGTVSSINYGMDPRVVDAAAYRDKIIPALKALPSFSLVTDLTNLFGSTGIYANPGQDGRDWERACSLEFIRTDGVTGFQANAGVRIRGGFSRDTGNPKHAFRFFFRDAYGPSKLRYPLHPGGTEEFDAFDLRTFQNYSWSFQGDPVGIFVRDQFSRDAQLALGQQGERGIYAHLYINGVYWGLFNTDERAEANFGATYFGGKAADYDVIKVEAGPYAINATDGTLAAWTRLYNRCRAGITNDAIYFALESRRADGTPDPAGETLLDIDNLIDYLLVIYYGGNYDAPVSRFLGDSRPNNWYGLRDHSGANGGFRFISHDAEHTLKADEPSIDRTGPFTAGNDSVVYSNPQYLHQRLIVNAEYRLRFADRVQRALFNNGPLTTAQVLSRFNARTNEIQLPVIAESARWGDSKRATPLTPLTQADWFTAVRNVQTSFLQTRTATLLTQLRAKSLYPSVAAPAFSQTGGPTARGTSLTLSAPAGQILYTINGEDPRQIGGGIYLGASSYTSPITLNESVTVKARTRDGNNWSALVEFDFNIIQTFHDLLITEIMYRPAATPGVNRDDLEFLELKNTGTVELDLSGVRVTNAVNFVFPRGTRLAPGKFAVLAGNSDAFTNRYPGVRPFGQFTGKLSDSGERITLTHAVGTTEFEVSYDNQAPWPGSADGLGFSLVPRDLNSNGNADDPARWRASSAIGGSPGMDDPPVDVAVILVNEVLTHTDPPQLDSIELFNPGPAPADISNWYLSDDRTQPRKYRFPPATIIPSQGYRVVDESQFNQPSLGTNAFRLSSHGDAVFLYSADATGLPTGYSDGLAFGAAPNGVSFGRYTNSAGDVDFPLQIRPTLGLVNAGPQVGPVVFNEILAAPAPGELPFVEIKNIASTNVPLFHPEFSTNRWRIEGLGFEFPGGLTLLPGGLAVVVGGDPATFRARHGLPGDVLVLGPYSGVLQPNGERLELQRPDAPDPLTNQFGQVTGYVIPYPAVDVVRYDDKSPWPTNRVGANRGGASLERRNVTAYGNDPANWRASVLTPSPGLENDGNRPPQVSAGPSQQFSDLNFPVAVALSGTATDDGLPGGPLAFTWSQTGGPPGVTFDNPNAATTTARLPGAGNFVLQLSVSDGQRATRDQLLVTLDRPGSAVTLVPFGSTWRYFDQRQDLGTAWRAPGYVEPAGWKSGPARLGYGGDGEVTLINGDSSGNRIPTAYFRLKFNLLDAAALTALTLQVIRDDGVVVYLNGDEVFRNNLPEGEILFTTLASTAIGGGDETTPLTQPISPARLRTGENTLAVEMHQANASSSDLGLDLSLTGIAQTSNRAPTADAGANQTVTLPVAAQLLASFTEDGLPINPGVPSFVWSKLVGPGTVTFTSPNSPQTSASFSAAGTYDLQFSVNDSLLTAVDQLRVVVQAATTPTSPVLTLTRNTNGSLLLSFAAEANRSYTVRRRTALGSGVWIPTATEPVGAARTISVNITPIEAAQYYQVLSP